MTDAYLRQRFLRYGDEKVVNVGYCEELKVMSSIQGGDKVRNIIFIAEIIGLCRKTISQRIFERRPIVNTPHLGNTPFIYLFPV